MLDSSIVKIRLKETLTQLDLIPTHCPIAIPIRIDIETVTSALAVEMAFHKG